MMNRRKQLDEIFRDVSPEVKQLVDPLLDELVWLESEMDRLAKLPQIKVHPTDPTLQKSTAAARLRKVHSQSYMNAVRVLLGVLNRVESSAQDELLEALKKFTL